MARTELRESDEARDRVKEENRALFEVRLEQEAKNFREQIKQRDKQLEVLREERDVARAQGGKADLLSKQLEQCKKKLEECQAWKREKEELKQQLDELLRSKQSGTGAVEHLHSLLNRTREEAAELLADRDEAQRQVHQLEQELAQVQQEQLANTEELSHVRRELSRLREEGISQSRCEAPLLEEGVLKQQRPRPTPPPLVETSIPQVVQSRSPKGSSVEELRQLLHTQKDDLLERLLTEKERATRAETTLQLKLAEVASLTEQRTKDAAQIAQLEEASRAQTDHLKELQSRGLGGDGDAKVREIQAVLAQKERELQVHRWRGQAESDSVAAQETLMVSCFHELGVRYQKVLGQNDFLRRRLSRYEPSRPLDCTSPHHPREAAHSPAP